MSDKIKLGYWAIRGKAQPLRLLLTYTGADWEDVVYQDPNQWFAKDKLSLGFDFPNLPYLIDGDLKLTETSAIEKYIIERSGNTELLGKNIQDSAKINQILGVLDDLRSNVSKLFFDKDYESKLKETWEKVQPKFQYFQKFIGAKDWALGYLTLADFQLSELSNYLQKLYPEQYKGYPSLQKIRDNLNNLDKVKEYYSRENAIKGPFLPPNFAAIQF